MFGLFKLPPLPEVPELHIKQCLLYKMARKALPFYNPENLDVDDIYKRVMLLNMEQVEAQLKEFDQLLTLNQAA